jgi:hypothetical protein
VGISYTVVVSDWPIELPHLSICCKGPSYECDELKKNLPLSSSSSPSSSSSSSASSTSPSPILCGRTGDMSRPSTPLHQQTNGLYSGAQTPRTPQTPNINTFSLTEYSANPTPPRASGAIPESPVPDDFLLPNGTPDVKAMLVYT